MQFKQRHLRALADMVVGDASYFKYRSSSFITEFFYDCGLDFKHDGTTRWAWTANRLSDLLADSTSTANTLPPRFVAVLRNLMDKSEEQEGDPGRSLAFDALNRVLNGEGFNAFFGDDGLLYISHISTKALSEPINPHRPFSPGEVKRKEELSEFLDQCSEDQLIEKVLLPLFRHLGFHRITAAGHKDKSLEYGKDIWMRFILPTQHVLYFGIQAKKGKLDAAGVGTSGSVNVAEIHNQVQMMLGHEIFDPEVNRKVLVDHAFIVAGGEITKQARNWLGNKLDQAKRSQILFMDREDILNLYVTSSLPLPQLPSADIFGDRVPF